VFTGPSVWTAAALGRSPVAGVGQVSIEGFAASSRWFVNFP
jgi:hypothetical protein